MLVAQLPREFGEALAALRQGKMTQGELANSLGVDGSTISRYERGELIPSLADAQVLLKTVGTREALEYADYLGQHWRFLPRPLYDHPNRKDLWGAEETLRRLAEVRQSVDTEPVRAQAELLEAALKREVDYLQSTSHSIAFIGQIAVGKTTALSTCAGLMLPIGADERRIKRTVLEVGGGNTTICEVSIRHHPTKYGVIVVPQSEDEVILCVNDLSAGVLSAAGREPEIDGERRGVPKEVDRALRNMCRLPKRQEKAPDGKRVTVDPLLDLVDGRNLEALASEVFKRLRLSQRTRSELWYDSTCDREPSVWLRSAFADVNNGRADDVGLPKQIVVVAPLSTLADGPYDIRMIDTKGIDEPLADRPDLRAYLEDPRTIPVLCSAFTSAPDPSVIQLLQATDGTGTGAAVAMRSVVLLLAKNDEALQVKHDSGETAETIEDGYEIKADKVRASLRNIGRDTTPERFALVSYNSDTDDPVSLAAALNNRVEALRQAHVNRLQEIARAASVLTEDAQKIGVAQVYARVHERLHAVSSTTLSPPVIDPFERLILAVRARHPRTIWASVVRQGSWMNLDVYHYIGIGVAMDAERRSRPQVSELEAAIGRMLANDEFAPVHQFLKEAMKSVSDWHGEFVQNAATLGRDAFRPALKGAIQLWNDCAAEYGRGYGFRDRVAEHLQRWFNDAGQVGVIELVELSVAEQWSTCFLKNVETLIASVRPLVEPALK